MLWAENGFGGGCEYHKKQATADIVRRSLLNNVTSVGTRTTDELPSCAKWLQRAKTVCKGQPTNFFVADLKSIISCPTQKAVPFYMGDNVTFIGLS